MERAETANLLVVVQEVVGSIPISHPIPLPYRVGMRGCRDGLPADTAVIMVIRRSSGVAAGTR